MKSHISAEFRQMLRVLPKDVRRQARAAYRQFKSDPYHPSLQFKPVDKRKILYSVRIGLHYRALGVRAGKDVIMWDWIGSHAEYDKLLKK
jgi:hypothetical protein